MTGAAAPADLMSPWALFLHADAVGKPVMIGLLLASVWTWGIIFSHASRLKTISRATDAYEKDFWAADDIDAFHARRGAEPIPPARIVSAGLDEWRRSARITTAPRSGAGGRAGRRAASGGAARSGSRRPTVPERGSGWRAG